jgi:hypothetical protein
LCHFTDGEAYYSTVGRVGICVIQTPEEITMQVVIIELGIANRCRGNGKENPVGLTTKEGAARQKIGSKEL